MTKKTKRPLSRLRLLHLRIFPVAERFRLQDINSLSLILRNSNNHRKFNSYLMLQRVERLYCFQPGFLVIAFGSFVFSEILTPAKCLEEELRQPRLLATAHPLRIANDSHINLVANRICWHKLASVGMSLNEAVLVMNRVHKSRHTLRRHMIPLWEVDWNGTLDQVS